jgi:hypothetical protein
MMEVAMLRTILKMIFPMCLLSFLLVVAGIAVLAPLVNQDKATPASPVTGTISPTHYPINATIVLNTDLPDIPSTMHNLRLVPMSWSKEKASQIAETIFGVTSEPQWFLGYADRDAWLIKEGIKEVTVYSDGSVKYEGYLKDTSNELGFKLEDLPHKEACIATAEQFIEKFSIEGLMPDKISSSIYYVGPSATTSLSFQNGTLEEYADDLSVIFRPSYDGTPLMGERFRVSFSSGGAIMGFSGRFREVELLEAVNMRSAEWAIEKGKEGYGERVSHLRPGSPISEVIIDSIQIIYRPDTTRSNMVDIWMPVYQITGTYVSEDGETGEFGWGVPATLPE